MLTDRFEREVTGVRVSLTDRCNFDCIYCHNEGLGDTRGPGAPRDDEMSTDDVVRFLDVAADFDVEAVKFTGGEPMLREDLEEIVRRTPDRMETSMTTNGTFLPGRARDLAEAGLKRVNVSQDAIEPEAFAAVTGTGALDRVVEGVEGALDAGLAPVKLNMVVFEHTAEYVPQMVDHVAESDGLQLQLIEYMPEIAGHPEWAIDIERVHDWLAERADEVETRAMHDRRRYWINADDRSDDARTPSVRGGDARTRADGSGIGPEPGSDGGDRDDGSRSPAERPSSGGMVEVVDPVENEDFCANCHRVRVTHDGFLKGCLNRADDHRSMGEMSRDEIRETFRATVEERVPFYGEYMVRDEDGEWVLNEKYC